LKGCKIKYFITTIILAILLTEIFSFTTISRVNASSANEEVTFYRVDINGRVTTVKASVTLEEGKELDKAIAEKCKELCKDDKEMKQSIENSGGESEWIEIESMGNGTHRAFRRIIFPHRKILWRYMIKYSYFSEDSYTNITVNDIEKSWKGAHSVRLTGFTGYVNFKPRILFVINLFGSTIIQGYARAIEYGSTK